MKDIVKCESLLPVDIKRKLVITIMIPVLIMVSVLLIFLRGYANAAKKYEDRIGELEQEVDRLSEPVAVYEEAVKEVNIRTINAEIQNIGELATVEYLYTDAGKFEDQGELFGRELPFSFTTKSFIVKWDGSIKAGVDISRVRAEVNEAEKEIIVYIPKAEILSHEIKTGSVETLDEKNGLFNKISVEDIREFGTAGREAMEQRAVENGLLDQAFENAEGIILGLMEVATAEEAGYRIRFDMIE